MRYQVLARFRRIMLLAVGCGALLMGGCARQQLDLSSIKQVEAPAGARLQHFVKSSYTIYMWFDLSTVKHANVAAIMQVVNPQGLPVANLRVTSQCDGLASLLNLANGGAVDRGVFVSMNKVTVSGDLVQ